MAFRGVLHGGVMKIDELAAAVGLGRVRITNRADEELHSHRLTIDQVCAAVAHGEIVEELAADAGPYPACRVAAKLADGEPMEAVWAWNARTGWTVLINAYRIARPEGGGREEKSDEVAVR